jgi:hypothetical protein
MSSRLTTLRCLFIISGYKYVYLSAVISSYLHPSLYVLVLRIYFIFLRSSIVGHYVIAFELLNELRSCT